MPLERPRRICSELAARPHARSQSESGRHGGAGLRVTTDSIASLASTTADGSSCDLGALHRALGTNGIRYFAGGLWAVVAESVPAEAARRPRPRAGRGLVALLAQCESLRLFVAEIIGAGRS